MVIWLMRMYPLRLKTTHFWGQSNHNQLRKQVLRELLLPTHPAFKKKSYCNKQNKMRNLPTVCVIDLNRNSERQLHFKWLLPFSFTMWIKGKNESSCCHVEGNIWAEGINSLPSHSPASDFLLLGLPPVDSNSQITVDILHPAPFLTTSKGQKHLISTKENHWLSQKDVPDFFSPVVVS